MAAEWIAKPATVIEKVNLEDSLLPLKTSTMLMIVAAK
jgi:hypothetical protein